MDIPAVNTRLKIICSWAVRSVISAPSRHLAVDIILLATLFLGVVFPQYHALAAGTTVTIHITGATRPPGFLPSLVTVHVNDVINFRNESQPPQAYTVAADDGSFFSGPIAPGAQWQVILMKPGTYEYHAVGVTTQMVGTILVAPASVALLPSPDPGVISTEITMIQTERTQTSKQSQPLFGLNEETILILVILVVVFIGLAVGSMYMLRRRVQK